jgi:mannose/cellobiose epimerase-like protein (N-acyl-D-glucosamine 2-epimerase family)
VVLLSQRGRAALTLAEETAPFIKARLTHPAGSFVEDTAGTLPRRQNSHMHLLEALHSLAQVIRQSRWLDYADTIVHLVADPLSTNSVRSVSSLQMTGRLLPVSKGASVNLVITLSGYGSFCTIIV